MPVFLMIWYFTKLVDFARLRWFQGFHSYKLNYMFLCIFMIWKFNLQLPPQDIENAINNCFFFSYVLRQSIWRKNQPKRFDFRYDRNYCSTLGFKNASLSKLLYQISSCVSLARLLYYFLKTFPCNNLYIL